jgi:hypothetical protein
VIAAGDGGGRDGGGYFPAVLFAAIAMFPFRERLAAPNAKILNGERARFEIAGGNFRMIVAFDFGRSIAFIKFIGTHAE